MLKRVGNDNLSRLTLKSFLMLQDLKNVYKKTHSNLYISLLNHLAVASSVSKLHCVYVNMPVCKGQTKEVQCSNADEYKVLHFG